MLSRMGQYSDRTTSQAGGYRASENDRSLLMWATMQTRKGGSPVMRGLEACFVCTADPHSALCNRLVPGPVQKNVPP
jgi:hypothetical protein